MSEGINKLGAVCRKSGDKIEIYGGSVDGYTAERQIAEQMRSSVFFISPLLALCGKAKLYFPGGCKIGSRPIDLHIDGLRALDVKVEVYDEYLTADASNARAGTYYLRYPSVGATENLIIFACSLRGKTVIYNAAREPEVEDLCSLLNAMGGDVKGGGTSVIEIHGGRPLKGVDYTPIPDRITAGTFATATLLCGGDVSISGKLRDFLTNYFAKIKNKYCNIDLKDDIIHICSDGKVETDDFVATGAYPDFATDLQPLMAVLMANSRKRSVLVENVFEDRFRYLEELRKGGCVFTGFGRAVMFEGGGLHSADYVCPDLRAGAALFVASLCSAGRSTLTDEARYIDRGYDDLCGCFKKLGANVKE